MEIKSDSGEVIEVLDNIAVYYEDPIEGRGCHIGWKHRPEGINELAKEIEELIDKMRKLFHKLLPEPGQQLVTYD